MNHLTNVVQPYAWGSRDLLAQLEGRPVPTEKPEAEVWMGAHPVAPSKLPGGKSLLEEIDADKERHLGPKLARRFGRLPFLLKLLAAGQPLSLQAHPSLAQAKEGFARENAAGIPLTAPHRNYKDDNHKPELIVALTPFQALCGFRPRAEAEGVLAALGGEKLSFAREAIAKSSRDAFEALMTTPKTAHRALAAEALAGCDRLRERGFSAEAQLVEQLHVLYPDDVGVVTALLLNLLTLLPGESLYLPAGNLHAYVSGLGVELMAASDNVLRGGLTPKHVDVPELLRVLSFHDGRVTPLLSQVQQNGEAVYSTPAPEFRLSRVGLKGQPVSLERRGPEILVCTEGRVQAGANLLSAGQSVFVSAADPAYTLGGEGVVFRATANDF